MDGFPVWVPVLGAVAAAGLGAAGAWIALARCRRDRDRALAAVARLEADLQATRAAAEIARHSRSQFVATVSHELRTPLNAVIGFAEIIKTQALGPVNEPLYATYAADIHDSAVHLLDLINNILDIASVDAGQEELAERPLSPEEMVSACLRRVRDRAERGGVSLIQAVDEATPAVMADERMVKQMLENLLSNAVKFTPAGGTVTVTVENAADGGMVFRIADTGIGIPAGDMGRIFDPFFQVDGRLNRHYDGAGLGLPLTRALIHRHGGTIVIDSTPGRGTTVRLGFPASRILR